MLLVLPLAPLPLLFPWLSALPMFAPLFALVPALHCLLPNADWCCACESCACEYCEECDSCSCEECGSSDYAPGEKDKTKPAAYVMPPKTGDSSLTLPLLSILMGSMGIAFVLSRKKRAKDEV